MSTLDLLVTHHMILVKNVAYLSTSGVEYPERMRAVISNAVAHISTSGESGRSGASIMLRAALEDELNQGRVEHPLYAEALRFALQILPLAPFSDPLSIISTTT